MANVTPAPPAIPAEAIAAVLDAFRTHTLVGLGDVHGNEQVDAFRMALIRDPRFAATVNDIVVEWGNSVHQDAMDQFLRGDAVADPVRRVLEDLSAGPGWEMPIYEEFFRAVRAVNAPLSRERQLRVLLGAPPIDWNRVHSVADRQAFEQDKDAFAASLIRREVLAKGRRALVAFGFGHLLRSYPARSQSSDKVSGSIVELLEKNDRTGVFTVYPITRFHKDILTVQANVASWPQPSLALLRGTILGATNIRFFFPWLPPEFVERDPVFDAFRMEDQFDAVLYIGPPSAMTLSRISPDRCLDSDYMAIRTKRLSIVAQNPQEALEPLQRLCADASKK